MEYDNMIHETALAILIGIVGKLLFDFFQEPVKFIGLNVFIHRSAFDGSVSFSGFPLTV